jgi:RHS repeat-associated protein
MGNSAGAAQQIIVSPKGGGAQKGIGEKFAPDLQTGTGNFTVPIALPPGRNGFQPQLNLVYSTGNGNGPFGLGWGLSIPGVSRKTWRGVPRYDDATDVFILSGAEDLVAVETSPTVSRYRPRTEGLFALIERHPNPFGGYWQVKSKDGLVSTYGTDDASPDWSDTAVIADPQNTARVFAWKLTRTIDPFGNEIRYGYERDQGGEGQRLWDQLYLKTIEYADYGPNDARRFFVSVTFDYKKETRPDPFSDYRAGFEIRTGWRCREITVSTHADQTRRVRSYRLDYLDELIDVHEVRAELAPLNRVSLLSRVVVTGHDDEQSDPTHQEQLPPLTFGYTRFQPQTRRFAAVQGADLPATSLANRNLELVDLFGRGLPDILEMNGTVRYWRNLGGGRFDLPRPMRTAPAGFALADLGVQLVDADGDGRTDLLVTTPQFSGYFPLRFGADWDPNIRRYEQAPSFNLEDPEVKLFDLDGDGVTDAIRSGTRLECFFSDPERGWQRTRPLQRRGLDEFPNVNFSDPRVRWADMTGDQLQDIVLLHDGSVEYWPNLGHGDWGRRVRMRNSPRFPFGYNPARILLGDVDGDGLADIVYVDNGQVTLWMNQCGIAWSDPIVIRGTPPVTDMDSVRLVDLLGNGISGILWSADASLPGRARMFFLDFTGGTKPYLLNEMDNHMGATTRVTYATSSAFYLQDERSQQTRWRTALPFPVQVVARVEVEDDLSQSTLVTEYRYHHGYWDGLEREFRGFGMVEQRDSESFAAYQGGSEFNRAYYSHPTRTRTWFHLGPVGEGRRDWEELDWSGEYWSSDPPTLQHTEAVNAFLRTLTEPRSRRDALRSLRGSILRTEFYADDGSDREERPYTVTEYAYDLREVREVENPEGDGACVRIFFPHQTAQRTTQWERGDDPMTQFSFTTDYDKYGQPQRQTQIACPRGWHSLEDRPVYSGPQELFQEPYLATRTLTMYGEPLSPNTYIHDRVVRTTSLELTGTNGRQLLDLAGLSDTDPTLRVFAQVLNYYDGPAYLGLPFGQVGEHGAFMRTESLVLDEDILSAAYEQQRPPYFSGEPIPWTDEYPQPYRTGIRPFAGYTLRAGPPHTLGLFATTERRQYDFQDPTAGSARGLVRVTCDALDRDTSIRYDAYDLLPVEVSDPIQLTTQAAYDYRVLQPRRVTDANGNPTLFSFTPLGLLRETWVRGKSDNEGDQERPSVVMAYDFLAHDRAGQPISVRTTRRVHHDTETDVTEGEGEGQRDETIATVEYSDGFGRLLQTRTQGEDVRFGDPVLGDGVVPADQSSDLVMAEVRGRPGDPLHPNVVVSGWQRYDNKGRVVEKFEPFLGAGWEYAPPAANPPGVRATMFYDPRGQVVRTVNPDRSEQRVIYGVPVKLEDPPLATTETARYTPTPWEAYTYDANDNANRTHPGDWAAAFEHHWNTPSHIVIDGLGRTVLAVQRNRDPGGPIVEYRTRSRYDIRGNLLALVDPLSRVAFAYVYDFANRPLRSDSIDAGFRTTVLDVVGNIIEQWDSKGALILRAYDRLNRPQAVWARNNDSPGPDNQPPPITLREDLEYGDERRDRMESARQSNRLGRLAVHHDEAGRLTFAAYDFKGNVLENARQVIADAPILAAMGSAATPAPSYQVDWQPPGPNPTFPAHRDPSFAAHADAALDSSRYETSPAYDALNRIKRMDYPRDVESERKRLIPSYNRAGALRAVALDSEIFVSHIAYNAKGQRTLIAYGNGVMTRYTYEPDTFRLARLRTERSTAGAVPNSYQPLGSSPLGDPLQDFAYCYDLVGNINRTTEQVRGCGVRNNPTSNNFPDLTAKLGSGDALVREFEYDPLYRLTRATGRESNDIPADHRPWNEKEWNPYLSAPRSPADQEDARDRTRFYSETYTYDPAGNMLQLRHADAWTRHFGISCFSPEVWAEKVENYLRRGEEQDWGQNGNRLTHCGDDEAMTSPSHKFDANGNLIKENCNRHYAWDHADRLVGFADRARIDSDPTKQACYLYDAGGMRVKKLIRIGAQAEPESASVETTVYIDDVFEHHLRPGDSPSENNTLHVMDNQSRVATVRAGGAFPDDGAPTMRVKYHPGDHLGSSHVVIGGVSSSGDAFISREEYFPYGGTSFGSFLRKCYRFAAKEKDAETALSYHHTRFYSTYSCRWTSVDPIGLRGGSVNLFISFSNNPVVNRDPSGMADYAGISPTIDELPQRQTDNDYHADPIAGFTGGPQQSVDPTIKPPPTACENPIVAVHASGLRIPMKNEQLLPRRDYLTSAGSLAASVGKTHWAELPEIGWGCTACHLTVALGHIPSNQELDLYRLASVSDVSVLFRDYIATTAIPSFLSAQSVAHHAARSAALDTFGYTVLSKAEIEGLLQSNKQIMRVMWRDSSGILKYEFDLVGRGAGFEHAETVFARIGWRHLEPGDFIELYGRHPICNNTNGGLCNPSLSFLSRLEDVSVTYYYDNLFGTASFTEFRAGVGFVKQDR